jgi:c-di-GMP-binding flagellar brake protein YcgR
MDDKRQHPRFNLEYTIQLVSQDGEYTVTAVTTDISDGGVRLPLPEQCLPPAGNELEIDLTIRRRLTNKVETFRTMAEVVRHTKPGADGMADVALRFDEPMRLRLEQEASAEDEEEPLAVNRKTYTVPE